MHFLWVFHYFSSHSWQIYKESLILLWWNSYLYTLCTLVSILCNIFNKTNTSWSSTQTLTKWNILMQSITFYSIYLIKYFFFGYIYKNSYNVIIFYMIFQWNPLTHAYSTLCTHHTISKSWEYLSIYEWKF